MHSNDPRNKRFRLRLEANVRMALGTEPGLVDFGKVKKGATASKTVRIEGYARDRIKILKLLNENEHLDMRLSDDGKSVTIKLLPSHPVGKIDAKVKFDTDFKDSRFIPAFNVIGQVKGPIKLHTHIIDVPKLAEGASHEAAAEITTTEGSFKITKVEPTEASIETRVETVAAGKRYKVHIKATENHRKTKVYIHTDSADQPKFEVLLLGRTR